MLDLVFNSVMDTAAAGSATPWAMILCTVFSLLLGICGAGIYMYKNTYRKNFVVTLALLPAMVQVVIMLVNGNLGAGVAVVGAFSLIRFRSVPGSAKEISSIFFAMAIGLATGMGYLGFAVMFLALIGAAMVLLQALPFGNGSGMARELKIMIPEDLDYEGLFDDIFDFYLTENELERVKTSNMGSLYELQYRVELKKGISVKQMMDEIRVRNGNLNVSCSKTDLNREEL